VTDRIFFPFTPLSGAKEPDMPVRISIKSNSKSELDKKNLEVRKSLEERLNRLNALWEQVEEKLVGLQTPRHVSIVYASQTNPETGETVESMLALEKIGGNWRLCHGIYFENDPYELAWKPITDCSAEIRVDAAQQVSKLKEQIVRTAEEFLPKIDNAISSLDKALSNI
jgi:hypothetical protein